MNKIPSINSNVLVHSYKHNGKIHRIWDKGLVVAANEEYVVVVNNKTQVIESDGRVWVAREPAVNFFYLKKWFNVICMIRKTGIYYYCNIASPSLWDGEAIKYIDYDLDLKVYPDGSLKILDEDEYECHKIIMNYSKELDLIVKKELSNLMEMAKAKKGPFDIKYVEDIYLNYLKKLYNI